MAIVNPSSLFTKALSGGYAIGAFNVNNMEIVQGIMLAAQQEESPVILQISAGARKYAGATYIKKLIEAAVEDNPHIPIVLHLDHGQNFEICKECIDHGFSSVMIDGSHLPFEENVVLTKRVVDYAKQRGVFVEAELGQLAGIEEDVEAEHSVFTDPNQAKEFVERTGCNSLAIAIGTSHGAYKFSGEPKLDFGRLDQIMALLPNFPLVLHGASSVPKNFVEEANTYGGSVGNAVGIPEEFLRKAASTNICKVNIDTDIRLTITASIRKYLSEYPEDFDPRGYLKVARQAVAQMVAHKISRVLGSSHRI